MCEEGDMLKKNKLLIYIILLFIVFSFKMISIAALKEKKEIENVGVGNAGELSGECNTGFCGNTVGITIGNTTFSNTAVYGMRVTIVDKNGNKISNPVNIWANNEMVTAVKNSSVKKHKNNKYRNVAYTKLYEWSNGGLRNIDVSGKTYAGFIADLKSTDVQSIVKNLLKYDYDKALANKYFLKIEPIFVLHFHYYDGSNYFLQGTPAEIFSIIYYDNVFNSDFRGRVVNYFFKNGGFEWNVIKNYFFTTFVDKQIVVSDSSVNDNTLPYWKEGNSVDRETIYDLWFEDGSNISGLATGYLWIPDESLVSTLYVTKYYGTPDSSNLDTTQGQVCFRILQKTDDKNGIYSIYGAGGKTRYCNHIPYNKNEGSISNWHDQALYQQFSVKLPAGKYKLREIDVADDVETVAFRQKNDSTKKYTDVLTSYKVNVSEEGYESQEFELKAGGECHINVYNKLKDTTNDKGKITVYKYLNKKYASGGDIPGFSINDNASYPYVTHYKLYKSDKDGNISSLIESKSKNASADRVQFSNLEPGYYVIKEYDISNNVSSVGFYDNKKDKLNDIVLSTGREASSKAIYVDNSNKVLYVYNTVVSSSCNDSLQKIKNDYCSGGNRCSNSNKPVVIKKLYDLFENNLEYNRLLNYEIDNTGLDLSKVSCSNYDNCDGKLKNLENKKCTVGSLNFIEDDTINPRVCSISNYYNNNNIVGTFYVDDVGAFCYYNYNYRTNFSNDSVYRGRLLWSYPSLGDFNINVSCEGAFSSVVEAEDVKLNKESFENYVLPSSLSISYESGNNYFAELSLIGSDGDRNSSGLSDIDANVECDNIFCYVTWNKVFKFNIYYNKGLYSLKKNNGTFFLFDYFLDDYNNDYDFKGYGLPISFSDTIGEKNATFMIGDAELTCPYTVKKTGGGGENSGGGDDGDGDDRSYLGNFDIDFRIIDPSNPFPGEDGNGRLTGSNWCLSSNVGKIIYEYDEFGNKVIDDKGVTKFSIVGDITGDYKLTDQDYSRDESFFKLPVGDINGSGDIEYDSTCASDSTADNCILQNYIKGLQDNSFNEFNCSSNNENVIKYIIGDEDNKVNNSDSTDLPMYSFTLTPNDIQTIRNYNLKNSYTDFNLSCDSDDKCISNFLSDIVGGQLDSTSVDVNVNANNSRCYNTRFVDNLWCSN